jgi:ATP-binding cassette subfamily C protein
VAQKELRFILGAMPNTERIKVTLVITCQCLISLLDVAGVLLVGVLGGLLLGADGALQNTGFLSEYLERIGFGEINPRAQAVTIGLLIFILLLTKSALSVFLNWRFNLYLSRKVARFSKELLDLCFKTNYRDFRSFSLQEISLATTRGSSALFLKSLLGRVNILVDCFLLIAIFIGLLWFNLLIGVIAIPLFLIFSAIVYSITSPKVKRASEREVTLSVDINDFTYRTLENFKAVTINGAPGILSANLFQLRLSQARNIARVNFMPILNKYVFEISTILIVFVFGGVVFLLFTAQQAFAVLGVFLAASTRIAPALARVQQSNLQIKSASGLVNLTMDVFFRYRILVNDDSNSSQVDYSKSLDGTSPQSNITIKKGLLVAEDGKRILSNINMEIKSGSRIGIIGESGSGKTSLVECILGLIPLTGGSIDIGGLKPEEIRRDLPNYFGYVPQSITLPFKTIKESVSLGRNYLRDDEILDALRKAGLTDLINELGNSLEIDLSNRGRQLSGGEIQRIAIAQALLSNPKLLILDEATSALDAETESEIVNNLSKLPKAITILVISHRQAALKGLERIYVMENGEIIDQRILDE